MIKSMLLIAATLLGLGVVTTSATAAPTTKTEVKAKVRPETSDCPREDWSCRLGVVGKTNERQDLALNKVRGRLNKLATVGARQKTLEVLVQMLPAKIRQETAGDIARLKDYVDAEMEVWKKRCGDFENAINDRIDELEGRLDKVEETVIKLDNGDHWIFGSFGEYRSVGGNNWGASAGFGYHWNFGVPVEFMVTFGGLANEHVEDGLGSYSLRFGVVPQFDDFRVGVFGEYAAAAGADGPKTLAQHLVRIEPRFGSDTFAFAPSCAAGHGEEAIPGLEGDPDGFSWGCNLGVIYIR